MRARRLCIGSFTGTGVTPVDVVSAPASAIHAAWGTDHSWREHAGRRIVTRCRRECRKHALRRKKRHKERDERRCTAGGVGLAILLVLPHWQVRVVGVLPELRGAEWRQHV